MPLQYRARSYRTVEELETALNHEARANWKPTLLDHRPDGTILVIYSSNAPGADVAAWDKAAQVAEEANFLHEFPDPREED
jgi:hypothetical protein